MAIAPNDCVNCPSYLDHSKVTRIYGQDVNFAMCARHGHVLSRSTLSPTESVNLRESFAEHCPDFGNPAPEFVKAARAEVAEGDPDAIRRALTVMAGLDQPDTCTRCIHFIPSPTTLNEWGWNTAACAVKGRLLFDNKLVQEATHCVERESGSNRYTTDGLKLRAVYDPHAQPQMASWSAATVKASPVALAPLADPRDYETDRPVGPKAAAANIRAWREVPDPEGLAPSKWWPIMDWEKIYADDPRESYVNHRPELFIDHAGLFYDVVTELMKFNASPNLIGAPGTGKTDLGCVMAYTADLRYDLIQLRADTETFEFFGEKDLVDGATGTITEFTAGIFTKSFPEPGITMLDEINVVRDEIGHYLRPVLLGAKRLHIASINKYIERNPMRFIMSAMNPPWMAENIGTKPLAAADFRRMSKILVDLPPEHVEREIIRSHCKNGGYDLPELTLDYIMKIAKDIRALAADGQIPTWGIGQQIMVAQRTEDYSIRKAYRRAVTDGLETGIGQLVLDAVEAHVK